MVKNGDDQLTRIANDQLEKFRLKFSRCTSCDVANLNKNFCVSIVSSACTEISVSVSFDSTKDQKKILCVKTYINHNLVSYRICIDYGCVFS